ncbi:hypothetical protein M099_3306 [Phocaeicola vulgatus str. 3975 RP4]|uniref:Uncharacterized protein n=1 Tax=Phocaeicola vulgatus str. 3975 RP4 TaxID=1339352 RepID=A0A069SA57_PHOVU|nr:hypothetical protein M099_3306 [Phocaeicola vulgatus str. 3975 RP4]
MRTFIQSIKKIFIVVFVCYYLSAHTTKIEKVYQLSNFSL